ncbi:PREDICTED: protein LOW PSII ACCUMULATION 1, chloroplastic [Nicotiana attenuata]|uniref:Protein low psii accumulation 1, chloroplastic n=1 Tax=Nicotiana attenuata TaxID=49451 RepID=A0A314KQ23_NICAT|nr:PREDICTED: protein LOW PSII ACCUMULATION 1, chloroplastic [Nicotiana attenuata]OIT31428.1 protein low psii accumulation 1, chloroplastic [Nicotiana attenuata]
MATAAQFSYITVNSPNFHPSANKPFAFSCQLKDGAKFYTDVTSSRRKPKLLSIVCSNSSPSSDSISSTAKTRSEVLTPFRSVRMFFYVAFIASAGLGGLIASTRLIAALANSSRAAEVPEILKGLGIDLVAVSVFAFLYYRENRAKNAQVARLVREENLANLKLRVDEKKIVPLSAFRGIARLVILAGPSAFISECFRLSEPFTDGLLERGVLVVPFATDGISPSFEFEENEELEEKISRRKRLWQLAPLYATEWTKWIDEQKKLANVSPESPVYLSLRLDGRVRGSGVGYPPWNAFVVQLPPVKGIWSGLLDGMDGRV